DAPAGRGLRGENRLDVLAGSRESRGRRRRAAEVVAVPSRLSRAPLRTHAASIDSRVVAAVSARTLFAPLGPTYDRYSSLLSFGQAPRWRRFLVSRLDVGPGDTVLDVATGTGLVARELVRRFGCSVVGIDQSPEMLAVAAEHTRDLPVRLVEGRAESLPFSDD